MIKVLIVEDQVMLRDTLAALINAQPDMQVVESIGNAASALELCYKKQPNIVLMDVRTENNENGIVATERIREAFPDMGIIVMTGMPEITYLEGAKKAGADSFLYKNVHSETLLTTIRSTMEGYGTFPRETPRVLPGQLTFTDAEITLLKLVCKGKSRKEMAKELMMSEGSVKASITNILNKTGHDSIMKFAIFAMANGYLLPDD